MKATTAICVLAMAAVALGTPLGNEFTYQGVLSDGGAPAAGPHDFRFILYDAEVGGSQVGPIVLVDDLDIAEGRMTADLDFGSIFDGTALWLEVAVRDGGSTGSYTVLSPRQELTAAPFAQHARQADSADTAGHATTADSAATAGHSTTSGDADLLDGQEGTFYLTWSNFTGIPEELANGDDDTLADLACAEDEIARWNGSAWSCSPDDESPYVRTYVVGPVGTPTENGLALLTAFGDIPQPTSAEEAIAVKIEPGIYDLGTGTQALFPWMVIEGADRKVTKITSARCGTNFYEGTLWSTSQTVVLKNLSIENTCADPGGWSIAFSNQGDETTLENVTLSAIGAAERNIALFNGANADGLAMTHVHIVAVDADLNQGIENWAPFLSLFDVDIEATGGDDAIGVVTSGIDSSIRGSWIRAFWATASCKGVVVESDTDTLTVLDSVIWADAGTAPVRVGIENLGSAMKLRHVEVQGGVEAISFHNWTDAHRSAHVFDVDAYGETGFRSEDHFDHGCSVYINDSRLWTETDAVNNVNDSCSVDIVGSQLAGGVTGAATCAGVTDDTPTFYASTCPP